MGAGAAVIGMGAGAAVGPHLHAEEVCLLYDALGVGAGRVQEGEEAQEAPAAVLVILARDGQRADTPRPELLHLHTDKLRAAPEAG
jgi:hypothetical protein